VGPAGKDGTPVVKKRDPERGRFDPFLTFRPREGLEVAVGFEPTNNGFAMRWKEVGQEKTGKSQMALEGPECPPGPVLHFDREILWKSGKPSKSLPDGTPVVQAEGAIQRPSPDPDN
jgi:hypothetical protein